MGKVVFTRKDIYELVWKEPLSMLSKKYALSDNGFRKLCTRFNIPIPKNGHYQKLKFNKPVKIEKLPADFIGEDKIELQLREEGSEINLDQSPLTILTKQILSAPKAPLTVPEKLTKPDKLTIQTKEYWATRTKDRFYYNNDIETLSISVEKNNRTRALLFMDTLVKLLRYRGHTFGMEHHEIYVEIDSIKIVISLREATKRVPSTEKYTTYDYIPTNEFILKTGKYWAVKEWRDGKLKLEEQLAKIVAKLEIDAQYEKAIMEKAQINRLKFEEERRIKEELIKQQKEEYSKFQQLLSDSERYNKAIKLRKYINAIEERGKTKNNISDELNNWIKWANDKADWYDPLISKLDDILDTK